MFVLLVPGQLWGVSGCQDPFETLEPHAGPSVSLASNAPLEEAPRVPLMIVDFGASDTRFGVNELQLFQDELSSHAQRQVVQGELSESLLERSVAMLSWQVEAEQLRAQPSVVLEPGRSYSLVALGVGLLARLQVRDQQTPVLRRLWPEPQTAGGAFGGVYCAEMALPAVSTTVELMPDGAEGQLSNTGAERCLVLEVEEAAAVRVPTSPVLDMDLDPAPLVSIGEVQLSQATCNQDCEPLGPGCACPEDDRILVQGPLEPAFWLLGGLPSATAAGSSFVVPGLMASQTISMSGMVFDLSGRGQPVAASVSTTPPRPRLLINEVYADANGSEPQQEWVELVNAGTLATSLEGYVLEDAGGPTPLPPAELSSGQYAVVVNNSYQVDPRVDVPLAPSALVLRVERLGKNGLANSGEQLRLRTPTGELVSRFPQTPKPKPGVSVARRSLLSLDDDPDGFGLHADPGASPGAPNQLAPP